MHSNVVGLVTSVLGILCGLSAIIGSTINRLRQLNNEKSIRQSIIENHIDLETAKLLITPIDKQNKKNPYSSMQWGCALLGMGLGYAVAMLTGLTENESLIILLISGLGVGLLISFIIKQALESKQHNREPEKENEV